ncbi:MAG: hypothetical protein VX460_14035 [Planctomycetota bacterium]|nr:hypothetical protein [Planctomycetota bacterium]
MLSASELLPFLRLNASLDVVSSDPIRRAAFDRVFKSAAALAEQGAAPIVAGLPSVIGKAMAPFGWAWNGFYAPLPGDEGPSALHVASAYGPPVCTPLERSGGALSSGMCFDGFLLNQTLCAFDAGAWPGYVSCDATSGLGTVAGIVVPVRGAGGAPVAVWDLDSTEEIEPGDVRAMDVLFASLARTVDFDRAHFQR